jgi:hypothetical protein
LKALTFIVSLEIPLVRRIQGSDRTLNLNQAGLPAPVNPAFCWGALTLGMQTMSGSELASLAPQHAPGKQLGRGE